MRTVPVLLRPVLFLKRPADFLHEDALFVSADLFVQIFDKIRLIKKDNPLPLARMHLQRLRVSVEGVAEPEEDVLFGVILFGSFRPWVAWPWIRMMTSGYSFAMFRAR